MAKIRFIEKTIEIQDDSPIANVCEELGVPFDCRQGSCGTCKITVEGGENLSNLTEMEELMGMDEEHRLACQCRIKKGIVKIKY